MNNEPNLTSTDRDPHSEDPRAPGTVPAPRERKSLWMLVAFGLGLVLLIAFNMK